MRQSSLLKRGVVTILFVCQIFSCFHGYGYISCLQNLLYPTLWLLTWFVCTFSLCQKLLQSYISNKVCGEYWVVGIYGTAQAHNIDQSSSYRSLPTPSLNKRKQKKSSIQILIFLLVLVGLFNSDCKSIYMQRRDNG